MPGNRRRGHTGARVAFVVSAAVSAWLTWERPSLCLTSLALAGLGFAATASTRRRRERPLVALAIRAAVLFLAAVSLLGFGGLVAVGPALSLGLLTACVLTAITMVPMPMLSIGLLPLWTTGYLQLALGWTSDVVARNLVACGAVTLIVIVCRLRSYLTIHGVFAGWLIGDLTWGLGGGRWFVPLLGIFLAVNWGGKLVRKLLRREVPEEREHIEAKGSERDHVQVLANAGVGLAILLVAVGTGSRAPALLFGAYLGSLSAACADTLASEIGILSCSGPVLLWTFRPVPPGLSGGVSALGYLGAALGALVPALALAIVDGPAATSPRLFLGALACGLIGSTVDSIAGATLQEKRRCVTCERVLERAEHCGTATRWASGLPFVTNDLVNVIGALAGGITGALIL
jgi:uncharacterized protein (TIGR00297 family)